MRLRRSSERAAATTTATDHVATAVWDGLPTRPAGEPIIRAPRAGDAASPAASATHAPRAA